MKDAKLIATTFLRKYEDQNVLGWGAPDGDIVALARAYLALLEENDYLRSGFVHTCHANCQKPPCVTRRTLERAEARLGRALGALKLYADASEDSPHKPQEARKVIKELGDED